MCAVPDLPPLNDRQAAFVREYLLSGNATDAYVKAGYAPKHADVAGPRLLGNVGVAAHIAAGRKKIEAKAAAEFDVRQTDILRKLVAAAFGDRNELTQHRIIPCRYCYGIEHRYQWRTHREFCAALDHYRSKNEAYQAVHPEPESEGGFGYTKSREPNPDCPECDGDGEPYVKFTDSTRLTPEARALFDGVRVTKDGTEIKLPDRAKALETLGKHIGMFKERVEHTGKDGAPIQTETTTRVVIVPAKIPAEASVRPLMTDDEVDP
jgi:hypothetical protein